MTVIDLLDKYNGFEMKSLKGFLEAIGKTFKVMNILYSIVGLFLVMLINLRINDEAIECMIML